MELTLLEESIVQMRRQLDLLHRAIAAATRRGDLGKNARLTLEACQIRRRLLEAQAQMFG